MRLKGKPSMRSLEPWFRELEMADSGFGISNNDLPPSPASRPTKPPNFHCLKANADSIKEIDMLTPSIRRFAIIVITLAVLVAGLAQPAEAGHGTLFPERTSETAGWQALFLDFMTWLFGDAEVKEEAPTAKVGSWWVPDGLD